MSITPLRFLLALGGLLALAVPSTCARTLTLSGVDAFEETVVIERVLREAYGRLGIDLVVERVPGKRSLKMAVDGVTDGELVRIAGVEFDHDGLILVPVAVGHMDAVAFTSLPLFPVSGWRSLEPYRVGLQRGLRGFERGRYRMEVILVTSTPQLFRLLVTDRVDAIVVPGLAATRAFHTMAFKGVRRLDPPLATHDLYHYLHWKNRDLVPAITEVLRRMRSEGRIRQIREDYIRELSSP